MLRVRFKTRFNSLFFVDPEIQMKIRSHHMHIREEGIKEEAMVVMWFEIPLYS